MKTLNSNNQYILTVIILTYNHKDTIKKAIESVLEQNTNFNFIINLIDDCSTDGTTEICQDYAKKYPDKIIFTGQKENTKGLHGYHALLRINTKYWTCVEGDDYWCDKQKLQLSVDILNAHPECSIVAHNYIGENKKNNIKTTGLNSNSDLIFTLINAPYIHTSTRMYRHVIDFSKLNNKLCYDSFLYYQYLDLGNLYYINRIMSVYNITGNGIWSSLTKDEQDKANYELYYRLNYFFDFKYDDKFSRMLPQIIIPPEVVPQGIEYFKEILGKELGWEIFMKVIGIDVPKEELIQKKNL